MLNTIIKSRVIKHLDKINSKHFNLFSKTIKTNHYEIFNMSFITLNIKILNIIMIYIKKIVYVFMTMSNYISNNGMYFIFIKQKKK